MRIRRIEPDRDHRQANYRPHGGSEHASEDAAQRHHRAGTGQVPAPFAPPGRFSSLCGITWQTHLTSSWISENASVSGNVRQNRQPVRPRSPSTNRDGRTRRNGGAGGDARYAIGIGDRTADHGQGLSKAITVLLRTLFHLLSRSREYRVCGADPEQGSWAQLVWLRAWRRRFFLELFHSRGAEQFDSR